MILFTLGALIIFVSFKIFKNVEGGPKSKRAKNECLINMSLILKLANNIGCFSSIKRVNETLYAIISWHEIFCSRQFCDVNYSV